MTDSHDHHHVNYGLIFFALCLLTGLSWFADEAKERGFIQNALAVIVIVLSISTAKALFVMAYFMHLKFEGKWKFLLLAPTVMLAIGLPLALLPDIGEHYYLYSVPQNAVHEMDHNHSDPAGGDEASAAHEH